MNHDMSQAVSSSVTKAESANIARAPLIIEPGQTPTLRSLAEDALVRFDIARWLLGTPSTCELSAAMTEPRGEA